MHDPLSNLSPLDGRYARKVDELRNFFSEAALMRYRVLVEVEWFLFLCNELKLEGTKVWKPSEVKQLRSLYEYFDAVNAGRVKKIEETTNHDVKAIEYFLKENLRGSAFEPYFEFIHFACTSEDINNLAYGLMIKEALKKVVAPLHRGVCDVIFEMAKKYKQVAMMARTHGQPATPTTMGKEFVNVLARVERQVKSLENIALLGKLNGAVGNYNAHLVAYPNIDWPAVNNKFIQRLGLEFNPYTTQIEPHDSLAEIFDALRRINVILIDFNRDIWTYISMGYFKQKLRDGEVGSSTMPHKVNPIDFENSEGNLGLANALFEYFSSKLPLSRLQRDLTDSTTLRNIGAAVAYSVLAYKNCIQGLRKLELNCERIENDLDEAWELLAEPIQVVMRKYALEKPYEQLKALTRGKKIDQKIIHRFVDSLKIPEEEKKRLKTLTPSKYIGLAVELVEGYISLL